MKTLKKEIEEIQEHLDLKLSPREMKVFGIMSDGSEKFLYSYPSKKSGEMRILLSGGFDPYLSSINSNDPDEVQKVKTNNANP